MPLIIGTAGHIDHGKTSLVKALTGEDTDRLKEEKERGISIDLGFAHFDLPDGSRVGVVDVPGHERFIRNMLAGAHGIDLVLFTVAADDGVMPQTAEHLDILHLLGVERAVFVITKADLVTEERLHEVEEDIQLLTEGTSLANSPALPFSFVTSQGLPELRKLIVETLLTKQSRRAQGYFRLPVDRAFALQGHGLVVTGTALSGEVHSGQRVRSLPGGQVYRVRSVQVHDQAVERATCGQRVALNLSGHERGSIVRGDVVCDERLTITSTAFDAFLEVRPSAGAAVKNHQRVRVHAGTAERLGKLIVLGGEASIKAKASAYCQIRLTDPIHVLRGDRFVLRDETARRTLAGGVVVHPWAGRHKRSDRDVISELRTLHQGSIAEVLTTYINGRDEFAVSLDELAQFLNQRDEEVDSQLADLAAIKPFRFEEERLYTTDGRWNALRDRVIAALRKHHADHPLAPGMDMEELRALLPQSVGSRLFRSFVEQLEAAKAIVREGSFLRLPQHAPRLGDEAQRLVDRINALMSADPLSPPDMKQLGTELGANRSKMLEVLTLLERQRVITKVTSDQYFLTSALARMKATVIDHLKKTNELTPATFRELFGTSRKYTIPLLEYLDREGVTVRKADVRRLKNPV
jgi:selenocysteine-specific elongation factor